MPEYRYTHRDRSCHSAYQSRIYHNIFFFRRNGFLMADEVRMVESTEEQGVQSESEYSDTSYQSAGSKRTRRNELEVLARSTHLTLLTASWMRCGRDKALR